MNQPMLPHAKEIVSMIEEARHRALQNVNAELIGLYWRVGEYLSREGAKASWGDAFIDEIARQIGAHCPGIKGFTRRGLYRMKRFYETYRENTFVTEVLTQISWSHHLAILTGAKTDEEREFYIRLSIREKYSARELQRQIDSAYFHRAMLSAQAPAAIPPKAPQAPFLDTYVLEFLDLPQAFSEQDLRKSIIHNLRNFILEIGKDFSFVGEEVKVSVGNNDFFIDLLFFHRGLSCLVAFELKINSFKPEYVGKMNFYLEALDRDFKKPNENPSIGVILCASKDDEVVEYTMSRSLSPTRVADFTLQLIDKKVLEAKMREYRTLLPGLHEN